MKNRKEKPKVSIITVVKNGENTLENAIKSVLSQDYKNIEYIVLDGKSTDGTPNIIGKFKNKISKVITLKDKGVYDAINIATKKSNGDIIGILHCDDIFYNKTIVRKNVDYIYKNNLDFTFSDLIYVDKNNKIFRKVSSKNYSPSLLKYGIHPPHPTLFVKKNVFNKYGGYSIKYKICSDFDYFAKLFGKKLKWKENNLLSVIHKRGGKSDTSFLEKFLMTSQLIEIQKKRGIPSNRIFFIIKLLQRFKQQILK